MLWSEDVGPEVVELSSFPDIVDGMRRFLVQDSTGTFPGRRAITPCASLRVAGLFIESQSALLAMVLLRIWQWWRLGDSFNVRLGGFGDWRRPLASASAENSRDSSEFFYPLGCYLQCF
jgi:hypothetical protein